MAGTTGSCRVSGGSDERPCQHSSPSRWREAPSVLDNDCFDHAHDRAAQSGVFDFYERFDQRMAVGVAEKIGDVGQRRTLLFAPPTAACLRRAFEKERHWYFEDVRDLLQAAGTDA